MRKIIAVTVIVSIIALSLYSLFDMKNEPYSDFVVINSIQGYYRIHKGSMISIERINFEGEVSYYCYVDAPCGSRKVIEFKDVYIQGDYITADEQRDAFIMEFSQ